MGMEVRLAHPAGYGPNERIVDAGRASSRRRSGGRLVVRRRTRARVVRGADVVYTDAWTSMGQEAETEERREAFRATRWTTLCSPRPARTPW